ncbi:MAG: hypothetical protein FWG34_10780 [Oscillospiraceae bacterium]|nr:hypothetical protein [Oscillospiraceae bacterium]
MTNPKKFIDPPAEFRPANYWGWLAKISPEESAWQVEEMHKAGLGGYVAHSRGGRLVPYMGREWMDSVRAIIETGEKYKMATIMDDEDGWPSGFGGGKVTAMGEDHHVKWLVCGEFDGNFENCGNLLGIYDIGGKKIKIAYESDRHYVDNMNPQTVEAFIEAGYESYYGEFAGSLYGIFSDEPQLARYAIPWSNTIPGEFHKNYGYDLMENLPAIFCDIEGCEKVRFDFWKLVSALFEINYAKKIGEWCKKRNLIFTGHTTLEEVFWGQMQCSGGTMQFYEWLDIPGMDWLCRVGVSDVAVKQLSSVSEQLGKKRALSEMYGCAGWNIGFDDMKWIGEWHYVLGVNYMLQHLGLYSLLGSRKREYPASLFYQQPWWADFKLFNDYFARLSQIMSESTPIVDILILHPLSGAWVSYDGSRPSTSKLENDFNALSSGLLGFNYDHHYGDDAIIGRHAKIEGKKFSVGNFSYSAVIIPSTCNIASNTLSLLLKFAENGGAIFAIGEFPRLVDGRGGLESAKNLGELKKHANKFETVRELAEGLKNHVFRPLCITYKKAPQNGKIYSRTVNYENQICHYIVNTDNANEYAVDILAENGKNFEKLNLESCEFEDFDNKGYILRPTQSLLLFETGRQTANSAKTKKTEKTIDLNGKWEIKSATPNALVLDMCRYSFDAAHYGEEIFVLKLQKKLLGEKTNRELTMEFAFDAEEIPEVCFLLIEEPEKHSIKINGENLAEKDFGALGFHYDKSFKKIAMEKYIKKGANKIELTRNFYLSDDVYRIKNDPAVHEAESNRVTFETELESIYLLGDFSVSGENGKYAESNLNSVFADCGYKIKKAKKEADINDLTRDGMPFFAGTVHLECEFHFEGDANGAILSLNHPDATIAKVFVNGEHAKDLCWEPYEADIGKYLKPNQKNTIGLELTNSLRNLLGPHHNKGGEQIAVGPHSFGADEGSWTKEYNIVRFGAGSDVKIVLPQNQKIQKG